MTEQASTHTSSAKKNILGGIGAAFGAYVLAPIVVSVSLGGLPPGSPIARVIDFLYPQQVSNQLIDAPVPQASVAPMPVPSASAIVAPAAAVPAVPAAPPAETGVAMTSTPANAPLKARIEPPVLRYEDGSQVLFAMTLVSNVDALPVFTMNKNTRLLDWSATVKPSNATCSIGYDVAGVSSYYSEDEWRHAGDDMSKLGKDFGVPVSGIISCSEKVRAGDTITLTARINYMSSGARVPVTLYSQPLMVVAK